MEGKEKPGDGSDAKEESVAHKEDQSLPQTETNARSDDHIMRDVFHDHLLHMDIDFKHNDPVLTEVSIGRKANGSSARVANKLRTVDKLVEESRTWLSDSEAPYFPTYNSEYSEDGTPLQQVAFMRELENFRKERLWRAVIKAGGYDVVTTSKLWRQVGESFHPPRTCTTVSWTFRIFYEKALLEYEKHKRKTGEIQTTTFAPLTQYTPAVKEASSHQAPGSGRARRDAAARAMQGWHAQRLVGYGSIKHRTPTLLDHADKVFEADKQAVINIMDLGPPADWVKISVRETKDCFEVYALVPGLLREEVRVQSDPTGRLVITGQPEHLDNPWGITSLKKVVSLPGRIDPMQTSAVVSLHGRLVVRVPFEQRSF